jgi:hypothetical protein
MSLTIVAKSTRSRVRIGGEYDKDGARGFVLLEVSPSPAQLTRREARDVARALIRFAEAVRPTNERKGKTMDENRRRTHDPGRTVPDAS